MILTTSGPSQIYMKQRNNTIHNPSCTIEKRTLVLGSNHNEQNQIISMLNPTERLNKHPSLTKSNFRKVHIREVETKKPIPNTFSICGKQQGNTTTALNAQCNNHPYKECLNLDVLTYEDMQALM